MKSQELTGQLSIFDIKITEGSKEVTKTEEKITENRACVTKSINKVTSNGNEKIEKPLELTPKQQKFLNENKFMKNENLSRIILHPQGSITVEVKEADLFTSYYINSNEEKEAIYNKKLPVLPWDKIIYSAIKEVPLTQIQKMKLKELYNGKKDIKRVIHRKGDENIIIELESGTISITSIGWTLPFQSMAHVECVDDEIYKIPDGEMAIGDIQKAAKVGDYVQVDNAKEIIEGKLISNYNGGCTFSIIYGNGTKHTAIPRVAILKILKSA